MHSFTVADKEYRAAYLLRGFTIAKGSEVCVKCGRVFEEGDVISLACFVDIGQRRICGRCADEID
jgi:hypothetical protein